MPENFVPLHTEIERISSGNIQPQDVADYYVRHGKLSPYEATPTPITGDSYDEYEQSIWSDFAGEVWNSSVVSATRGLAEYIPLTALANKFRKGFTPNEKIASVAKLVGKEDAYRNSWVGRILGGLDEGYKKIGADYITKPLSDVLPSVLFDALPKTLMGEEGRNKFFEDWIANVDKITEGMKAPVTDGKSFFQDPSARSFVKGMGQGIGFMASVLLTKKWGTAPSMAVSVTQMAPMYYDEAKNAGLTSEQAASFATALAPVIGATEYFGLDMVGKVAMKPVLNALRKESVVAGAKAFSRVLEESGSGQKALNAAIAESNSVFGKSLKTIGVATASGAAIEGGEEFGQTYIEEGYKQYFDKVILPNAKFNVDITSRDTLLKASEGAFFGGILGGLLGGGHGVFSAPSNQEVVQQSMFNIIDASNNKEKALKGILSNVENAKNKGTISEKEYEGAQQMAKSLYEYVNSLPVSLTDTTAKYQAYQFISERNMLAEQLDALNKKGGDPVLATADDDIRNFLQGGIEVYNTAIETIGKTKGQVSNAEIERQITELRDKYLPTSRDIETAEEGVGEAVETGDDGVAAVSADELTISEDTPTGVTDVNTEVVTPEQVQNEGVIPPVQETEVTVTPEVQVSEYDKVYERNQNKLQDLKTKKLKKGETQEARDMAIANLEQQAAMVREKLDDLKGINPQVRGIFEQIQTMRDGITSKGGKRKQKKDSFTAFVAAQSDDIRRIHDNFKDIVNQLENKGLLTKSSPEC